MGRRAVRFCAAWILLALAFSLGSGQADAAQLAPGHLPVPEFTSWLGSLFSGSPHWGATPRQAGGSADGARHDATTAETSADGGAGNAPGRAPGELAPEAAHDRKVTPGRAAWRRVASTP